jgi:hypothetical protein
MVDAADFRAAQAQQVRIDGMLRATEFAPLHHRMQERKAR